MARKINGFTEYDAAKAEREEKQEELVQSKLESLVNQHPAVKHLQQEAQSVRKKARRNVGIVLYGRFLNSTVLLERIDTAEKEVINRCRTKLEPELRTKAQREVLFEIIRENIKDLAISGVRISQTHQEYLLPEEKESLYGRLVVELEQLSKPEDNHYFQQQFPEIQEFKSYRLPFDEGQMLVLKRTLRRLAQKKYIHQNNADTLVSLLTSMKRTSPPALATSQPATSLATETRSASDDHLQRDAVAEFEKELMSIVGEEYATTLLRRINVASYETAGMLGTYLRTARRIQEEIGKNPRGLTKKYGPNTKNVEKYASLDALLRMKEELFKEIRLYQQSASTATTSFDVEKYKDKLLELAGLDVAIARAYTEGKNGRIVGENNYMPRRHFKSNAKRKAPPDKFYQQGDEVFDELVRKGAMVCRSRGRELYSLNPDLDTITDRFLREYMRVTVHYEKILKQKKQVRPLIDVDNL